MPMRRLAKFCSTLCVSNVCFVSYAIQSTTKALSLSKPLLNPVFIQSNVCRWQVGENGPAELQYVCVGARLIQNIAICIEQNRVRRCRLQLSIGIECLPQYSRINRINGSVDDRCEERSNRQIGRGRTVKCRRHLQYKSVCPSDCRYRDRYASLTGWHSCRSRNDCRLHCTRRAGVAG